MKSTIAKKTDGYSYKYTELADINKYCEENNITYYQEVETSEINQKDYIITFLVKDGKEEKHRGCQIVEARLNGINNPVQEYGSSLTYCRRYSLLMALGLACEDDDGATFTEVKEVTQEEANSYKLTFGKYKGKTLKEVYTEKPDYIEWMLDNAKDERMIKLIQMATGIDIPSEEESKQRLELMSRLSDLVNETECDYEALLKHYKVKSNNQMTVAQLQEACNTLEKRLD